MTPQQLRDMPIEMRFRLFAQWLGNQPENGRYSFASTSNCAMCQFARSLDGVAPRDFVSAGARDVFAGGGYICLIPKLGGFKQYGLLSNSFGSAYSAFASSAGLPKRAHVRGKLAHALASFIKLKNPLAA